MNDCGTCGGIVVAVVVEDADGRRGALVCRDYPHHGPDDIAGCELVAGDPVEYERPDDGPRATKIVMPHRTPDGTCSGAGRSVDIDTNACPVCESTDVKFAPGRPPEEISDIAATVAALRTQPIEVEPPMRGFVMAPFQTPCCGHLLTIDGLESDGPVRDGVRRLVVRRVIDRTDLEDPELSRFRADVRAAGRFELHREVVRLRAENRELRRTFWNRLADGVTRRRQRAAARHRPLR